MKSKEKITNLVDKLIQDGETLCKNPWEDKLYENIGLIRHFVDLQGFNKWLSSFNLLLSLLGHLSKPWQNTYESCKNANSNENALAILGSLKSIKESIDDGLLVSFEDIVYAEAFSDLVEQAEYLYGQNFFIASGVLLRAVLEGHLKKLCVKNGCLPIKVRPTISDYNQNLYTAKFYDKITFKHVDTMAAIGNAAAHNDSVLNKQEVERFLKDLPGFLLRFST